MGLGSRSASRHQTVAAQHAAGVDPSAYWDFQPGQKVMTVDGFTGTVASVQDGPLSGTESYTVVLANNMGGGEYTASQLRAASDVTGSVQRTAADDYPELGTILVDRPDIAPNTVLGSLRATARETEQDWPDHYHQCPDENCGEMINEREESVPEHMEREHGYRTAGYEHKGPHDIAVPTGLEPNDGAAPGVDEHGHLTWDGASPGCRDTDGYSMFGQNDAVEKQAAARGTDPLSTSECNSYRDNPTFCNWHKTDHLEPDGEPRRDVDGHMNPMSGHTLDIPKCDLCDGFHDTLHHYSQTETADHYREPDPDDSEWVHTDHTDEPERGSHLGAKQASWDDDDQMIPGVHFCSVCGGEDHLDAGHEAAAEANNGPCNCGHEPGSHTDGRHAEWARANNRDSWGRPLKQPYDGHGAWDCNNHSCAEHPQSMYDTNGLQGTPGWLQHDAHPDADLRRQINQAMPRQDTEDANWLLSQQHQGPTKYSSFDPWSLISTAAADADFRFHVTAAWSDVRNKAKRLRSEGRVHVTAYSDGMIHGEVKGDHHVYETGLQRLPGKSAIQSWSCGCKWGAYHWGAADDFSRFAGRMCSHALALQYEAQSRGMFGRTIGTDDFKPSWVPRTVVVKYDIDEGRNVSAPATQVGKAASLADTAMGALMVHAMRTGESFEETAFAFRAAQVDIQKVVMPVEQRPSIVSWAAASSPWGEPTPAAPQYGPGPTKTRDPNENPASAGWASQPDPQGWGQAGPGGLDHMVAAHSAMDDALFEPEMPKEAFLPLLIPLAEGLMGGAAAAGAGAGAAEIAGAAATQVGKSVVKHVVVDKALDAIKPQQQGPARPAGPSGPGSADSSAGDGDENNPLNYGARATFHEEPEGALPSTDGADIDAGSPDSLEPEYSGFASTGAVSDIVAQFQATAGARLLQGGESGPAQASSSDGLDIAAAAKAFLETGQTADRLDKTALKAFSPAEQAAIIGEGANVRAANFDRLNIAGTHYEPLEAALAAADDDEGWMS